MFCNITVCVLCQLFEIVSYTYIYIFFLFFFYSPSVFRPVVSSMSIGLDFHHTKRTRFSILVFVPSIWRSSRSRRSVQQTLSRISCYLSFSKRARASRAPSRTSLVRRSSFLICDTSCVLEISSFMFGLFFISLISLNNFVLGFASLIFFFFLFFGSFTLLYAFCSIVVLAFATDFYWDLYV